jgi:hypothetical protein
MAARRAVAVPANASPAPPFAARRLQRFLLLAFSSLPATVPTATGAAFDQVFVRTGDLTTARNQAAAVRLHDGSALVVGSSGNADRYRPSEGAFQATGPVRATRFLASAFTLGDGSVFVVGGSFTEPRGERFDPNSGEWTWTAPLAGARSYQQAALLQDGRVLVAGGRTSNGVASAAADLYDPVAGTFESLPSMPRARADGIAETLLDGRVLIAGGLDDGNAYVRCSTYFNPRTQSFSTGPCFAGAEDGLDLTTSVRLADGRVLIAGGWETTQGSERVATNVEIFEPSANRFVARAMEFARVAHSLTLLLNETVLVAGGMNGGGIMNSHTEIFDPHVNMFTIGPTMLIPRYQHTATLLRDGRVLIAGGETVSYQASWTASAELYEPDEMFGSGFEP